VNSMQFVYNILSLLFLAGFLGISNVESLNTTETKMDMSKEYQIKILDLAPTAPRPTWVVWFINALEELAKANPFDYDFSIDASKVTMFVEPTVMFDTADRKFMASDTNLRLRKSPSGSDFSFKYSGFEPDIVRLSEVFASPQYEDIEKLKFEENVDFNYKTIDGCNLGLRVSSYQRSSTLEPAPTPLVINTVEKLDEFFPEAHTWPGIKKKIFYLNIPNADGS